MIDQERMVDYNGRLYPGCVVERGGIGKEAVVCNDDAARV